MLRWMYSHTIMNRIKNQEFREKLKITLLPAKMRENKLILVWVHVEKASGGQKKSKKT